MQQTKQQSHSRLATKIRNITVFSVGLLLGGGSSWTLQGQSVHVSVWSSTLDHSVESVLVFQARTREATQATVEVYDDLPAQQISHIGSEASSRPPSTGKADEEPSMDQEADTLILSPIKNGAETIVSTSGSNLDFLLVAQLLRFVKPQANRIGSGVTGSSDIDSLAIRNPDGTYVLLTINHSTSAVNLEAFWKDRLITYSQAGNSTAFLAWDPKSQLVTLVPGQPQVSSEDSLLVEAKCSNISPLGIDLSCESHAFSCSVFPVRFDCDSQKGSVALSLKLAPLNGYLGFSGIRPGVVTITAAPDVGEKTSLHIP